MKRFLPLLIICLVSCSENRSECEKMLEQCLVSKSIPVDLPEPEQNTIESSGSILMVEVTAQDRYLFNEEEYSYDDLIPLVDQELSKTEDSDRKLKIAGDKMAHYEAIFRLITFSKERNISPILVYSQD